MIGINTGLLIEVVKSLGKDVGSHCEPVSPLGLALY